MITSPSTSPENRFITPMDSVRQLIRRNSRFGNDQELFAHTIRATEILDVDDFAERCRTRLAGVPTV